MSAGEGRRDTRLLLLAALTAVAWVALVIAVWGILSLLLDLDVIPQGDAGPLLGPIMVACAAIVLLLLVLRVVRTGETAGIAFFGTAAAVYLVLLFVGGVGYALIRAQLFWLIGYPLGAGTSPFLVAAALLAGIAALLARAIGGAEQRGTPRPRWPWENPSDE
jgi:hypothetical protein